MATKNIVPRADSEGGIGTTLKRWASGWFDAINGKDISSGVATTAEVNALVTTYAPIAKGVTNGDSHDHSGGDGGQIAYSSLSGAPTIPAAGSTEPGAVSSSTSGTAGSAATFSRSDHGHDLGTHSHAGATNGGQIAHTALSAIGTNTHTQIDTHLASTTNPHGVTAAQANAIPATGTSATAYISAATESVAGKVQLATAAEAQTGTDTAKAVTPATAKAGVQKYVDPALWLGAGIPPTTVLPTFQWRPGREDMPSIVTATRASIATRTNELGLIEQVANNIMREDFDPVTGECLGLLIEEQRTNLLTYSEQFDNAAWSKVNVSVTANADTAPDGTLTADKLVEDMSAGSHVINPASVLTITSGAAVTASIFVRPNGRNLVIGCTASSVGFQCIYDLTNLTTTKSAIGSGGSVIDAGIISIGGGWYRCWVSGTYASGVTSVIQRYFLANSSLSNSYTGDGTSGLYIWGAQLEAGAFPTSYIPTTSAATTRSADVVTVATSAFPFNVNEGTLYVAADIIGDTPGSYLPLVNIDDGTNSNTIAIYRNANGRTLYPSMNVSGLENLSGLDSSVIPANTKFTAALAVGKNSSAFSVSGSSSLSDTSCNVPNVVSVLRLCRNSSGSILSTHICHLAYFPRRISNSQLQLLTA